MKTHKSNGVATIKSSDAYNRVGPEPGSGTESEGPLGGEPPDPAPITPYDPGCSDPLNCTPPSATSG